MCPWALLLQALSTHISYIWKIHQAKETLAWRKKTSQHNCEIYSGMFRWRQRTPSLCPYSAAELPCFSSKTGHACCPSCSPSAETLPSAYYLTCSHQGHWMSGGNFSLREWWGFGTRCSENLWMPHPWRCSRPGWMRPWAAWFSAWSSSWQPWAWQGDWN